jgi:hypothetical protein
MEKAVQSFRETWPLNTVRNVERLSTLKGKEGEAVKYTISKERK